MKLSERIDRLKKQTDWLESHRQLLQPLEDLEFDFFSDDCLDFNSLNHSQIIRVIQAIGGTWTKSVCSTGVSIDYQTKLDGITVRCWNGEPPASCKIVETEEEVPAQPAGKRKIRKLVCPEGVAS